MTDSESEQPATDAPDTEPEIEDEVSPEPSELVVGALIGFEENGLAADESRDWPYRVAPSEGADGYATIALPLRVRASYRLDGVRFARSFIEPDAETEIRMLVALLAQLPDCPLTIFGHADPVGSDEDNKTLSGRRARALFALLVRDVDAWNELHQSAVHGDKWGLESIVSMLDYLQYDPGPSTGRFTDQTRAAIESFQGDAGLDASGSVDEPTRRALMAAYMDALCASDDGKPFVVPRERFLGGFEDPEGKAAYQGCGELNLRRRPSADQERAHANDKALRDAFHAVNRRVTVVLFEPGTTVAAADWPCPKATEGSAGCTKRLWSDEKDRMTAGDAEREFWIDRNTFRCRFYHRLHLRTVAEGIGPPLPVDFALVDHFGRPAANVDVEVRVAGLTRIARSGDDGRVSTVMPAGAVEIAVLDGRIVADPDALEDYAHDPVAYAPQGWEIQTSDGGREELSALDDLAAGLAEIDTEMLG